MEKDLRTFIFTVHCDVDYVEHPEYVELALSPKEIDRIGQIVDLMGDASDIEMIEVHLGYIDYYDNDEHGNRYPDDTCAEMWRVEGERVRVRGTSISVIGFDKYSGYAYWSDSISWAQMKNVTDTYQVPN